MNAFFIKYRKSSDIDSESGIAMFLVLWILTILSVIAGEFCYTVKTEVNITRNFKENTQAHYIARAGIFRAIHELVKKQDQEHIAYQNMSEDQKKKAQKWRVNVPIPAIDFGQGYFEVHINNVSGKVNINLADAALLRLMLQKFELPDRQVRVIVDSIMDWRDKDSFHHLNGAENDYYESLSQPYPCRNGDFESIEELLLVRGVTRELFFNGLRDMVTVYEGHNIVARPRFAAPPISSQKKKKKKPRFEISSININAAGEPILMSFFNGNKDLVDEVIRYRMNRDIESTADLRSIIGGNLYVGISSYISMKMSPIYEISSTGKMNDGTAQQTVKAIVQIDRELEDRFQIIQWIEGTETITDELIQGS